MTPAEDRRARDRLAVLVGLRAGGGVLMLIGLYMALGGGLDGAYGFGGVLIVIGGIGALLLPRLLARRWRSPR